MRWAPIVAGWVTIVSRPLSERQRDPTQFEALGERRAVQVRGDLDGQQLSTVGHLFGGPRCESRIRVPDLYPFGCASSTSARRWAVSCLADPREEGPQGRATVHGVER